MQKELALKLLAIAVVGMIVLVPVSMVKYKIYERQGYLEQARAAVSQSWTGRQLLVTPVLVIPYQLGVVPASGFVTDTGLVSAPRLSLLQPERLDTAFSVANKTVRKGIYEVPVFDSQLELSGRFSGTQLQAQLERIRALPRFESFREPFFSMHISDMRGIDQVPELRINQAAVSLEPGSRMAALPSGVHASFGDTNELQQSLDFSLQMSLRGMGSLSFLAMADVATTSMRSDWPHPEFIGASLPRQRDISDAGFSASWSSSRYSSQGTDVLMDCLDNASCEGLWAAASGVQFIDPVDVYLQSERSLKYAMLFIGLSFITFFIFEHLTHLRIHPIQYAFVGLAIAVFYLLLISLAEHIAFHWAYLIAVLSCSALILFYVRYMLRSFRSAALFCTMLVSLYAVLYVIVQAEDFALLMGSILVFGVLATLMYVTRRIDWYRLGSDSDGNNAGTPAPWNSPVNPS